jgi:hypothetical protein
MRVLRRSRRLNGRRLVAAAFAAAIVAGAVGAAARGQGYPDSRVPLSDGGAWLASTQQGLVTLINGAAEQVVGSVLAPGAGSGDALSVVQSQASAFIVNGDQGTVSRVDGGTYSVSPPVRFAEEGSPLQAFAGGRALYVVDSQRRTATVTDPVSLNVRERLSLAAQPGPDQSVVDAAGRLWVVDRERGGLTFFDPAKRVRPDVADAGDRLVLVQGRPVLVDLAQARLGALSATGTVRAWSCLDVRAGDQVQLLGSQTSPRVFATVPGTGTMVAGTVGRDDCNLSVDVGKPGDRFGQLVESGRFVFVPNHTSGRTIVVDVAAGQVAADLAVVPPNSPLELLAKDGFVFYNNPAGDQAGVFKFEDGRWRLGRSLKKFDLSDTGKGILTPADGSVPVDGDNPAGNDPPGNEPTDDPTRDPGQPDQPGGNDPPGQDQPPGPADPEPGPDPTEPPDDPPGGPPGGPAPGPTDPTPSPPGNDLVALTVQVTGGGRVFAVSPTPDGRPDGVVCTATCVWRYPRDSDVVLRAPDSVNGSTFRSMSGCTVSNVPPDHRCTLTLTGAATVRAEYQGPPVPDTAILTASRSGQGTLTATPAGGSTSPCNPTCNRVVDVGTDVALRATAATGHRIARWNGASACGTSNTCNVTVQTDTAITVVFEAVPVEMVTLTVSVTGGGTVRTISGGGRTCSTTCDFETRKGTTLILSTTSNGRVFTGWGGVCSGTGTCSVSMTSDKSVTASFRNPRVTVRVFGDEGRVSGPNGFSCLNTTCTKEYSPGQQITLTAHPAPRRRFVGWGGACDTNATTCTVTMSGDVRVEARFIRG